MQAQESNISSDCENFNSIVNDSTIFDSTHLIAPFENGILFVDCSPKDSLEIIIASLGLDSNTSFELLFTENDFQDTMYYYSRHQQFYKGIRVDGGGYTVEYIRNQTDDPDNPCDNIYSIAPRILTEISIDTAADISLQSALEYFESDTVYDSELIITHNFLNECEYLLVWRIAYSDTAGGNKCIFIDANTGDSLTTIDLNEYINAPTITYGTQNFENLESGNNYILKSTDQRFRVLDFDNTSTDPHQGRGGPAYFPNWKDKPSPFTSNSNTSWGSEATTLAYQAFYVVEKVLPEFDGLGIGVGFTDVRVGTFTNYDNANARPWDDFQAIYLGGDANGGPTALFDIAAHELAHIYLRKFLSSEKLAANSLHEGLCDIIGTYIESKIQSLDWAIGGDDNRTKDDYGRNLQFPGTDFDCFTEVINLTNAHLRGKPLGHWFFLISQGKTSPVIPTLGLDKAIEIVLASLKNLGNLSDYKDLMESSLAYVLKTYGRCSEEFRAVAQAWELICIPTGYANSGTIPDCSANICLTGSSIICEESDAFQLCACGSYPLGSTFNWTIIGPKSTEYTSQLGLQGNSQTGGQCLTITDIPKYAYYPQYIKISMYSPALCDAGVRPCVIYKLLKLHDCNNDDPNCDYYSELAGKNQKTEAGIQATLHKVKQDDCSLLRVYDIYGRLIFTTNNCFIQEQEIPYSGIAIFRYSSKNNTTLKVQKRCLIHDSNLK
ncbi:MAG: M4 family metallopeptidase [Saprospiraceae bacterium]|nr:M4 family metallopeptidase [Saprospiraceae bacterium]